MKSEPPIKRRMRTVMAVLGVVGGAALVLLEWGEIAAGEGAGWFWMVIGALLMLLGLAELFSPRDPVQ